LAANILKISNSPVYGFSRKISSVSQAVTLFGIMQIYALIMSYSINENLKANTQLYGLSNEHFNDVCHIQSALLYKWYSKIDLQDAKLLASLALIMESGKLVLAGMVENSGNEKEFTNGLQNCKNIQKYEQEIFGISSYSASALLFEHWNMNPLYIDILDGLDSVSDVNAKIQSYIKILHTVRAAVNVKEMLTKQSAYNACVHVKEMHLNVDDFIKVALEVKKTYVLELKKRKAEEGLDERI